MDLKQLLKESSDDDLYLTIGLSLDDDLIAFNPKEVIEKAKRWVLNHLEDIKSILCKNQEIKELSKNGVSVELISATAALVESIIVGTAATPLAILICKHGISSLCKDVWLGQLTENE